MVENISSTNFFCQPFFWFQTMSSRESSPETNEFKKNSKGFKSKKPKPGQDELEEAVPAHILR